MTSSSQSALAGLSFRLVDVFSRTPLAGNSLTVFPRAQGLSTARMRELTTEMRQFESIFLTPGAHAHSFRARMFTMEEELPFAGHPVLGAAAVLHELHAGPGRQSWEMELMDKTVRVATETTEYGYHATMDQGVADIQPPLPESTWEPFLEALGVTRDDLAPGLPLQVVSTGLAYLIVPLRKGIEHAGITSQDFDPLLESIGAKFAYVLDVEAVEGRTWDPAGQVEDIATGSAAGPSGAYLVHHGRATAGDAITIRQGRFTGRPSELGVLVRKDGRVLVSGGVVPVAGGSFD